MTSTPRVCIWKILGGAALPCLVEHHPPPGLPQLLPGQNTTLVLHSSLLPTSPHAWLRGRMSTLFPAAYPASCLLAPLWRLLPVLTGIVVSPLPERLENHIPPAAEPQSSPTPRIALVTSLVRLHVVSSSEEKPSQFSRPVEHSFPSTERLGSAVTVRTMWSTSVTGLTASVPARTTPRPSPGPSS